MRYEGCKSQLANDDATGTLIVVVVIGAPGEIRTPGLLVRSQALYPTELRAHRGKLARRGARILPHPGKPATGPGNRPFSR